MCVCVLVGGGEVAKNCVEHYFFLSFREPFFLFYFPPTHHTYTLFRGGTPKIVCAIIFCTAEKFTHVYRWASDLVVRLESTEILIKKSMSQILRLTEKKIKNVRIEFILNFQFTNY